MSQPSFSDLGVAPWIENVCKQVHIHHPTPIQIATLPQIYTGYHLTGIAQTGSGKTACYCWPVLQNLSRDPYGVFAIVLLPSRELSEQVYEQFEIYGAPIALNCCLVVGGGDYSQQSIQLSQGPHIIIATPGRLADHLNNLGSGIHRKLKYLKMLVMDEADALFEPYFQGDLLSILKAIPKSTEGRQTLFFSATITDSLTRMIDTFNSNKINSKICNDNDKISTSSATKKEVQSTNPKTKKMKVSNDINMDSKIQIFTSPMALIDLTNPITRFPQQLYQTYIFLPKRIHKVYTVHLLSTLFKDTSGIIFVKTCHECQQLTFLLQLLEFTVVCLHSLHTQRRRKAHLMKFRGSRSPILVATDLASRGLDLPKVDFVINLNFPSSVDVYVHRVGRTARAGKKGQAVSFVTERDVPKVHAVEATMNTKLVEQDVDESEVLKLLNKITKAEREANLMMSELGFEESVEELKKKRKLHSGRATTGELTL